MSAGMQEYRVFIPKERHAVIKFRQKGLPGIGVVNMALQGFKPKAVFAWHLSIVIEAESLASRGMPSKQEQQALYDFGDMLDAKIKGENIEKPNALFLARITWNATRELVYRVYDPKQVNSYLQDVITSKEHLRPFEFRMENDPEWKLAEWHLKEWPRA